jgi:hypothetical protein
MGVFFCSLGLPDQPLILEEPDVQDVFDGKNKSFGKRKGHSCHWKYRHKTGFTSSINEQSTDIMLISRYYAKYPSSSCNPREKDEH